MSKATLSSSTNYPADNLRLKQLSRCVVTRSQLVIGAMGVVPDSLFDNLPLYHRFRMNLVGVASLVRSKLRVLGSDCQYSHFLNVWWFGYHHWLSEVCLKYLLFEKELRKGAILMPASRPKFVNDFLELFEIENLLEIDHSVYVPRLSVITNPNSGHFHPGHMELLRGEVLNRVRATNLTGNRRIYVSRAKANARKVTNEYEVENFLNSRGFERVELENTSFVDQVRLFAETKTLVSIHGAALTNSIFMQPGGRVIEIYPVVQNPKSQLNGCYQRLCSALGHHHEFLFGERVVTSGKSHFQVDDVIVDLRALDMAISSQ